MHDQVLLTGISGFLGGHVGLALLEDGYRVRGSVRNLDKADKVRATLAAAGGDVSRLDFVALDLNDDTGWQAAAQDCRFVCHTASPFVMRQPRDRQALIGPAVAGTERAVRAGLAAGVERIVLTSSMAAIAYGHPKERLAPFTAANWTNLDAPNISAYVESKTRAELRAWELMDAAGRHERLATINPSVILGPLLDEDPGTSATLVQMLLGGKVPAVPRLGFAIVDVRDVAQAHLKALTAPQAGGKRFPMGAGHMFLLEAAQALARQFPDRAQRVPRHQLPDWLMRAAAIFSPDARGALDDLGIRKTLDSSAVVALLGRNLIPPETALAATAASLIAQGLLR